MQPVQMKVAGALARSVNCQFPAEITSTCQVAALSLNELAEPQEYVSIYSIGCISACGGVGQAPQQCL